jgi:SP family myo-inositol transporter-like MFS transporter 13
MDGHDTADIKHTHTHTAVFALIGGCLNDRAGRRPVIMSASVIFTLGALCMGIARDRYLLLAGRVVVGAGIGK